MLNTKNMSHYFLALGLVLLASYVAPKIKSSFLGDGSNSEEDELIRKYLLNESPLYGYNRPKIWIHTTYEYNARKWESFGSRSSLDLNQPYLHLTVKSIIQHCADDFNICLIDDDSFSRLLPDWTIEVSKMPEPSRGYYRQLALAELLYVYGGMIVPNSFLCMRNLLPLYLEGIKNNTPFVMEKMNRQSKILGRDGNKMVFTADAGFMGSAKKSETVKAMSRFLWEQKLVANTSSEMDFFDILSQWCNGQVYAGKMVLVDGRFIGVKSGCDGKPILVEDLLAEASETNPLGLDVGGTFGILIPRDEILRRVKYQWFSVMSVQELLGTQIAVVKYMNFTQRGIK